MRKHAIVIMAASLAAASPAQAGDFIMSHSTSAQELQDLSSIRGALLDVKAHTSGWVSAVSFPGADAAEKIHNAIASLPAEGGVVDARGLAGAQPCATNPVGGFTKPFRLLLGAGTYQIAVPWTFGKGSIRNDIGQFIVGLGPEATILQPTGRFNGPAVIQIQPPGDDTIVTNASFSNLTVDMANVSNKTAIELLSASNLPAIHDVNVKNQDGRFVHIAPKNARSSISEGVTFHDWYFYSRVPKVAPGIVIENSNEVVFRDGKLLGRDVSRDQQVGVLIQAAMPAVRPINSVTEGITFAGSSIASYATGIKLSATGDWDPARNCSFIALTMEENDLAFDFAGHDAKHETFGNQVVATRYLPSTKLHARFDFAHGNMLEEAAVTSHGAGPMYVMTAHSSSNLLIRRFVQSDKSDVSDAGASNVVLGWLAGQGLELGSGGEGGSSPAFNLDAGATGVPMVVWRRQGKSMASEQVSDAFGHEELVTTVGSQHFRFTPSGQAVVPSLRVDAGVYSDGAGLKHRRVTTGTIAGGAEANVTISWIHAFADTDYTVTTTLAETGAEGGLRVVRVEAVTPGAVVVRVRNDGARPASGTLNGIAMHD